jgi:hypothetical protein
LTYHRRFQTCRVYNRDEGGVQIIQVDLAFCLKFVDEVEQPKSEHRTRSFPRRREPPRTHELSATEIRGASGVTEAVSDADGVNAGEVKENESGRGRGKFAAFMSMVAELVDKTKVRKGFSNKEFPGPFLWLRLTQRTLL